MSTWKPSTLADVAREAGVSPYTVSSVLNGVRSNTRVSAATRQRILECAARLNYHPNAQARSLVRQRSNTIGVLFDFVQSADALGDTYASGILQGIVTECRERYDVVLYKDRWLDAATSASRFRDRRTDGIILVAPLTDSDVLEGLAATGVPLCAISANPRAAHGIPCVDVDNTSGIEMAVSHLLSLEHRRIAHLTGSNDLYSGGVRRQAFQSAMAAAGMGVPPEYIVDCTYRAQSVSAVLPHLLSLAQPPTAIVAGNDNIALEVLAETRRLQISVPDELSIVGFDDVPTASHVTPGLTTVRQPLNQIGARAVRRLVEWIEYGESPADIAATGQRPESSEEVLAPELIVRESTAAVRKT